MGFSYSQLLSYWHSKLNLTIKNSSLVHVKKNDAAKICYSELNKVKTCLTLLSSG